MPSAEIITIGTEILLGDIVDTNARYLARALREAGIDLYRKTAVGDNAGRIAAILQEALRRADILITTGGLGPTVDDPTREAVALALGVPVEFHPELWEQIQERFQRYGRQPTENNRRQAFIPQGAVAVENPVGTAPAFIYESGGKAIISLPGVPSEMEYLMRSEILPYLQQRFGSSAVIKTRVLHTAGVGESVIDDLIGDLESLSNPTIGLAAHSGQVDVRITAKAPSEAEADRLICEVEDDLHARLKDWIYGADADTLEGVVLRSLAARGWGLAVVEAGLGGELLRRLAVASREVGSGFRGGEILPELPSPSELLEIAEHYRQSHGAEIGLGVAIYPDGQKHNVNIELTSPSGAQRFERSYGGPPEYAPRYALHHALDLLRKL